jgi:hypothetical protein
MACQSKDSKKIQAGLAEISSIRSIGRNIKLTLAAPNKSYEQEEQHQETNSKCPTSSLA